MSTPVHPVPLPGTGPWKTLSLDHALLTAPEGTLPAVVMDAAARPSYGLAAYLRATGVPWLTTDADGAVEDPMSPPPGTDSPLPVGSLALSGRVLHPANHGTVVGGYTTQMLESAGARPEYSGPYEPLSEAWDPAALTKWFRSRMPWSALVFAGDGVTGLLSAARTDAGVLESFDALITAGHPLNEGRVNSLLERAASLNSLDFGVELHFGADDGGVHAGGDRFRVPLATLLGPEPARNLPGEPAVPGMTVRKFGPRFLQSLALTYPLRHSWDGGAGLELRRAAFS